ncbi:chorismate pyruvate-lyase family protein [Nocardia brevicatena]|uniref:chorismate pyruvate-lyase family protein n=1 Tax=Nocardia brevicatena TaxID=37327 RepID=UPI0002F8592A|nr:chorismate pyruvate-lyase family protein [Nocardia brevicatena]
MLLRSDGSMTKLLEALLGEPLFLDLLEQRRTTADELPDETRSALGCRESDPVILRRSVLVTESGRAVSENSVAIMAEHELAPVLTDKRTPIGHSMSAAGRYIARTVLTTGVTNWTASGHRNGARCVYKESVLHDHVFAPVAYLHERIDPAFAPLERSS